jgi:hypothetical protein
MGGDGGGIACSIALVIRVPVPSLHIEYHAERAAQKTLSLTTFNVVCERIVTLQERVVARQRLSKHVSAAMNKRANELLVATQGHRRQGDLMSLFILSN